MADVKISQLPAGTANVAAVVPATNAAGNLTEKITLGGIAALVTDASQLTAGTLADARLSANVALKSDITTAINGLVDSAPQTLNTLNELAQALNDDASFATTVTNSLAGKVTNAGNVAAIQRLTQAEYDAIATPDATTLYVITE